MLTGRAHRFGDDVNTDYIIPNRRRIRAESIQEMAPYVLEDADPEFYSRLCPGDFIVAGQNFGCGSSRETAPRVIQAAGVAAVLAKSFARIFFRNVISVGLPAILCDTDLIRDGDKLEVDLDGSIVRDRTQRLEIPVQPLPALMQKILDDGGLVAHFRKHGTFQVNSRDHTEC